MAEKRIEFAILERLEAEQKRTNERIDKIDDRFASLGERIAEIKGALDVPHRSWFMRYVVAPLIVAGILGAIGEIAWLHIRLSTLDVQVSGSIAKLQLQQSVAAPVTPESLKDTKSALELAKKKKIKLPEEVVKDTGNKLLETASKNRDVWTVVGDVLGYRSFLNESLAPNLGKPLELTPKLSKYRESVTIRPNPAHPEEHAAFEMFYAGGYANPENSARFERFDRPQPEASGIAFFILNGLLDTIVIDETYMKNVIIRNANIEYGGGRTKLENVYFVNCTFTSLKLTPNGIALGKSLLASASSRFNSGEASTTFGRPLADLNSGSAMFRH